MATSGLRSAWRLIATALVSAGLPACATESGDVAMWAPGEPRTFGVFHGGAVAADHPLASDAGARILHQGGNAVDAAVATSFALSVVRPESCGIGGGGFMVIHLCEHPSTGPVDVAINYREMTPAAIGPTYYEGIDDPLASTRGGRAVAIPGTVAGLLHALERYGTMDQRAVLEPAIRLARDGFTVDAHYARTARDLAASFERRPAWKDRFAFTWKRFLLEGRVDVGDRIVLPEQADALELIAEHGAWAFYEGPIARSIVASAGRDGGEFTLQDLSGFRVVETPPLRVGAFGMTILAMPPPSSGGIVVGQILSLLDRHGFDRRLWEASPMPADMFGGDAGEIRERRAAQMHVVVEAMKLAFADRARYLGDPAFVDVPTGMLLSDGYLDARAAMISEGRTHDPSYYAETVDPAVEDGGTSHLCVVDRWGNAVACTETINLEFGSLVAVDGFGFCLNDQMDDFTTRRGAPNAFGLVQSEANMPAPGKRPLSSMSPTIVLDAGGEVEAVAGASGGPRIITATMLTILGGSSAAVSWPRFHHQWQPDVLVLEPSMYEDVALIEALRARGHTVREREEIGAAQAIWRWDEKGFVWLAASDPRKGGRPAGP